MNARDAMDGGGVLTIETALIADETCDGHAQPGFRARLRVTDTGCGIPADHNQWILEPFFTTTELGTGLGLTTVAHTVRQLQGSVPAIRREVTAAYAPSLETRTAPQR